MSQPAAFNAGSAGCVKSCKTTWAAFQTSNIFFIHFYIYWPVNYSIWVMFWWHLCESSSPFLSQTDKISWCCWTHWTKKSPSSEIVTPYWTWIHSYVWPELQSNLHSCCFCFHSRHHPAGTTSDPVCCLQFVEAKVYHNKLVNIRKEMIMLHEKTTKLKVSPISAD